MMDLRTTCWSVIRGAAAGRAADRAEFARRYSGVVTAYLRKRWQGTPLEQETDDAAQELFVECFRKGGVLDRAEHREGSQFRAYLFGVLRNVARRLEAARARESRIRACDPLDLEALAVREEDAARAFDRAWATAVMREASERLDLAARAAGPDATRRVEILRLRFRRGLPIREIATRLGVPAASVHHEYARARAEFANVLYEVVKFDCPGTPGEIRRECHRLLGFLR